jgi:hypothetical protein
MNKSFHWTTKQNNPPVKTGTQSNRHGLHLQHNQQAKQPWAKYKPNQTEPQKEEQQDNKSKLKIKQRLSVTFFSSNLNLDPQENNTPIAISFEHNSSVIKTAENCIQKPTQMEQRLKALHFSALERSINPETAPQQQQTAAKTIQSHLKTASNANSIYAQEVCGLTNF